MIMSMSMQEESNYSECHLKSKILIIFTNISKYDILYTKYNDMNEVNLLRDIEYFSIINKTKKSIQDSMLHPTLIDVAHSLTRDEFLNKHTGTHDYYICRPCPSRQCFYHTT
jgi:hypothetical protein